MRLEFALEPLLLCILFIPDRLFLSLSLSLSLSLFRPHPHFLLSSRMQNWCLPVALSSLSLPAILTIEGPSCNIELWKDAEHATFLHENGWMDGEDGGAISGQLVRADHTEGEPKFHFDPPHRHCKCPSYWIKWSGKRNGWREREREREQQKGDPIYEGSKWKQTLVTGRERERKKKKKRKFGSECHRPAMSSFDWNRVRLGTSVN